MAFKDKERKENNIMEVDELNPIKVGSVEDLKKLKEILVYLIENLKETKYKTELIKLSFILDYKYCKKFNKKVGPTTVGYIKYNYGPYSEAFVEAFNELIEEEILIEIKLPFGIGYGMKKEEKIDLDEQSKQILKEVIETFGESSLKQLKDFIYKRDEFKKTQFGKTIVFN